MRRSSNRCKVFQGLLPYNHGFVILQIMSSICSNADFLNNRLPRVLETLITISVSPEFPRKKSNLWCNIQSVDFQWTDFLPP